MNSRKLKLADINIKGGTQMRVAIDAAHVADLSSALDKLPAVTVFFDGSAYWLADGFHRFHAHRYVKAAEIACQVHTGTQRDAILFAAKANADHGLKRNNADKRKAVETLLRDRRVCLDVNGNPWSDRAIAEMCAVSHEFVRTVRGQVSTVDTCTDVDTPTDGEVSTFEPPATAENTVSREPKVTKRAGRDGKTYTVKPKKPAPAPKDEPAAPVEAKTQDRAGNVIPDYAAVQEAFETSFKHFDQALTYLNQVVRVVNGMKDQEGKPGPIGTRHLNSGNHHARINAAVKELRYVLMDLRPYGVCTYCRGSGKDDKGAACKPCYGEGWLTQLKWQSTPAELREAIGGSAQCQHAEETPVVETDVWGEDHAGNRVPSRLTAIFEEEAKYFGQALNHIKQLRQIHNTLRPQEDGTNKASARWYAANGVHLEVKAELDNLHRQFKYTRPHAVCPFCKGEGRNGTIQCNRCSGLGWLHESAYLSVPEEDRASMGAQ